MKSLLALLAVLLMSNASAGPTYQWEYVWSSPTHLPMNMALSITFSDAAVQSGRVEYQSNTDCQTDMPSLDRYCTTDPSSPIEHFYYSINGEFHTIIDISPHTQLMSPDASLRISVDFVPSGYLSGSIEAHDIGDDVRLSSNGHLFAVDFVGSDYGLSGGGCNASRSDQCRGALGVMRTIDPTEVLEPSSIALLGVALGGLMLARRRHKRSV